MFDFIINLFNPKTNITKLVEEGAVIVDVRSKSEYNAGHLPGSRSIPLERIRNEVASLKKLNKPIITVCRSGTRSGIAKSILKAEGLMVYNGGAWTSVKRQIEKP
jgi:phage shock protein E